MAVGSRLVESLESRVLFAGVPQYPDLTPWVSQQRGYIYGWSIDTQQIPGRTLLRLANAAINVGAGPMELNGGAVNPDGSQQVYQRVYASDGTSKKFLAGNFVYHAQHNHVHFGDFTQYNLRIVTPDDGSGSGPGAGEVAATSDKVSFCLLDSVMYDQPVAGAPLTAQNTTCSNVKQGISVGWADLYDKNLFGQWIDVTDVASGRYWLEVVIDPMNRIAEANEINNTARIMIDVHQGDNTLGGAYNVGALSGGSAGTQTFREFVGAMDTTDYYKFTVSSAGTVSLNMNELRANADLALLDGGGAVLTTSSRSGMNAESITRALAPGTYYVRANQVMGDGTYTLGMSFTPTAGAGGDGGGGAGGVDSGDGAAEDGSPPTTPSRPGHGRGGWNPHGNDHRQSTAAAELFGNETGTALPA